MTLDSELLDTAIGIEEKGYNYYKEKAGEAENKFSKRVLESLAQQELDHKARFKKLAEGKDDYMDGLKKQNFEQKVKEIFNKINQNDKKKEDWKEEDVYQKAIDFEKKTYRFYKDLLSKTDQEKEKDFLQALMDEESKHEESLRNILYYYTDQNWWLADEESKTWNWMNM